MFNLFKKSIDENIYAPVSGKCIDITEVDDIGFSSKSMGDGIAIIPTTNDIVAPCDGVVQMIFRTGHAFGIKGANGFAILIHIGIDTVNLEGKGFTILKELNQKVKKGEPIIHIDLDEIKKEYDPTTLLIITNNKKINKININNNITTGDVILEGIE